MRTATFAGAAALVLVSTMLVSTAIIGPASGQPRETSTPAQTAGQAADQSTDRAASRRVAALSARDANDSTAAAAASTAAPEAATAAPPQVALVIGNAAYPDGDAPLATPRHDARALAEELKSHGFDVELGENLSKQGLSQAIARFEAKIRTGATALLFFAGHGVQLGRESYLIPVDAQIWRPEDVKRDGIALDPLVAEMNTRGAANKLVVLDAARRNPFERRLRGYSSGLAPIAGPEGTLVLTSAAPGTVVEETSGDTSLFVRELIGQIHAPGTSADQAFNRTRIAVAKASGGAQVPAVFSAMTDDLYFREPGTPTTRQSAR